MAQEFVPCPWLQHRSRYSYRQQMIRGWVGVILYAALSALGWLLRWFFPYERAGGAAAFCKRRELHSGAFQPNSSAFLWKRADWLAHHHESGRLTNHQALIVLCLEIVSKLLQTSKWDRAKVQRLEQVLSWQSSEGWFMEYRAATLAIIPWIFCLASIYQFRPDVRLKRRWSKL